MLKKYNFTFLIIITIIFFLSLIPLFLYVVNFEEYSISRKPENWAQFGDFFGGTINSILSLLNLVALIFLSLKVIEVEDERNKVNNATSIKPFALIQTQRTQTSFDLELTNQGLGPLIIDSIKYTINDKEYDNFELIFFNEIIKNLKLAPAFRMTKISNGKTAISTTSVITLFRLNFDDESFKHVNFTLEENSLTPEQYLNVDLFNLYKLLLEITIEVNYRDLIDNKYTTGTIRLDDLKLY